MAIHRLYLVRMPSDPVTMPYLDILVTGPVGSPTAPVLNIDVLTTGDLWFNNIDVSNCIDAPTGWQVFGATVGDGAFFEWRGRPLRVETNVGQTMKLPNGQIVNAFIPRLKAGFLFGISSLSPAICPAIPPVEFSKSLANLVNPITATNYMDGQNLMAWAQLIDDPSYEGGAYPVIRLRNSQDVRSSRIDNVGQNWMEAGTGCFLIQLSVYDQRDEDRNPNGI